MTAHRLITRRMAAVGAWVVLAVVCAIYGAYAIASGLGLADAEKMRGFHPAFVVHAVAGGVVLIAGSIQFNKTIRARFAWAHRFSGRVYVIGVLLAGLAGVANAVLFDASLAAKLSFLLVSMLWLAVTARGYRMIRNGDIARHREWMQRSLAISLFFVSFSVLVPAFTSTDLDRDTAYALAVTSSWVFNLLVAEAWIRKARARKGNSTSGSRGPQRVRPNASSPGPSRYPEPARRR